MKHIVVIEEDGTLLTLWSDDLLEIYEVERERVTVERASHVEFCGTCNGWHIWERDTESFDCVVSVEDLMYETSFQTRQEALQWEKEEVERRLIGGRV